MTNRSKVLLFLAGVILATISCAFGSSAQSPASAPLPTMDLNEPSGSGGISSEPTALSSTAMPFAIVPAPTEIEATELPVVSPLPALLESRRLTLEYPPKIRTGDSDVIRLTLEVDTLGNIVPTAEVQGNLVTGSVIQIPNLYETHNVIAEARLDLAGPEVRPADTVIEPLLQGQSVTFFWSVRPMTSGIYRGTAWLVLRFVERSTGAESQKAISAQPVQIEATNFLGLDGNIARTAGGVGSIIGAVLGFPFIDDVLKLIWSRLLKRG